MAKILKEILIYDNIHVPLVIYKEMRMDVRISIRKDKAIMRLPIYYGRRDLKKNLNWAREWIKSNLENNAELRKRFTINEFVSGDMLKINGEVFVLKIIEKDRKNFYATFEGKTIRIEIPLDVNPLEKEKAIKTLQSRLVGDYFLEEINERINKINDKYFGFDINKVRLKYNKSNWGSRSSKNNINISTRLLFAPKDVQDYVFVHELAHFKEMNHSKRFWDIVRNVMPDYLEKEKWLKTNGKDCDF